MKARRGQSAIEYMMTYGWGILVILVVGVILWQMGFLELGKNVTRDKRGFTQVTPLDWSLYPNGTLTIVIQNNAGTIVNLRSDGTSAIMGIGTMQDCGTPVSSVAFDSSFRPGSTSKLIYYNCILPAGIGTGEYYRVNLTISYQNPSSGLLHKSNGVIWGPVG